MAAVAEGVRDGGDGVRLGVGDGVSLGVGVAEGLGAGVLVEVGSVAMPGAGDTGVMSGTGVAVFMGGNPLQAAATRMTSNPPGNHRLALP